MSKKYHVVAYEQGRKTVWSAHSTEKQALAAARRYRRKNADTNSWCDHYGYGVIFDGVEIHHVD